MKIIKRIGSIFIVIGLIGLLTGIIYLIWGGIVYGFNSPVPLYMRNILDPLKILSWGVSLLGTILWAIGLYS